MPEKLPISFTSRSRRWVLEYDQTKKFEEPLWVIVIGRLAELAVIRTTSSPDPPHSVCAWDGGRTLIVQGPLAVISRYRTGP